MAHFWHTPSLSEIEDQKHWELSGVERGVAKVRAELDQQKVADSQVGSAVAQRIAPLLIAKIKEAQAVAEAGVVKTANGEGRPSQWWYIILMLSAEKLAVITIKKALSFKPRDFSFNPALTALAADVARAVADQIDYEDWRKDDKDKVDRFFQNYTLSARNLKRLRERLNHKRQVKWDQHTGIQFGVVMLRLMADAVPDWFSIAQSRLRGGRWEYQFIFSEAAKDALFTLTAQTELSQPSLLPMICQPADWMMIE